MMIYLVLNFWLDNKPDDDQENVEEQYRYLYFFF